MIGRTLRNTALAATLLSGCVTSTQQAKQYKMTTPIPPGIEVLDKVESRLGTLRLIDGCPHNINLAKPITNNGGGSQSSI
jgi:hypothetical protein